MNKPRPFDQVEDLFNEYGVGAKPFLKWAGGKSQLLKTLNKFFPPDLKAGKIQNYFEPFVGGGAVFFEIAQNYPIENAFLYDINPELILTYKVIQKEVGSLIELLDEYQYRYLKLGSKERKRFYYSIRDRYNQNRNKIDFHNFSMDWIERAAQVIFLNKTCFNGLFRFNQKGEFNTPQGKYECPKILDRINLLRVAKVLELAEIQCKDFREIKKDIRPNSFVYYDPPYRPISQTSNFTSYSKNGFGDREQIALANLFKEFNKIGIFQMLSNSDPKNTDPNDDFFDSLYHGFEIHRVPAKRMINSDSSKRGEINELIITNYPL